MENVTQPVSLATPPSSDGCWQNGLEVCSVAVRPLIYTCPLSYSGTLLREPSRIRITFLGFLANIKLTGDVLLLSEKVNNKTKTNSLTV